MLAIHSVLDPDRLEYPEWSAKLDRSLRAGRLDHFEGYPHDEDYRLLRCLDAGDLFVDVGANMGQSILSALAVNGSIRIASFEANPGLWPLLEKLQSHFGKHDIQVCRHGLSDRVAELRFFIPALGTRHIATRGSAVLQVFTEKILAELAAKFGRGGDQVHLVETTVSVRPLDELSLEPRFVKIDVEGHESQVLRGMRETILRLTPILMVEGHSEKVASELRPFGYRAMYYHQGHGELRSQRSASHNTIYVAKAHDAPLRARGFLR